MKNHFLNTMAVVILMTTAANAIPRIDVPKKKLPLTEAQINAIKNERGRPEKENSTNLFGEESQREGTNSAT